MVVTRWARRTNEKPDTRASLVRGVCFLMGWVGKQGCLWQVLFVVGGWFDCLLPSLFDEGSAERGRLGAPGLGLYTHSRLLNFDFR